MAKVKLPIELRTQLVAGPWGTGDPYFDNVVLLLPFDGTGNNDVDGGTGARDRSNSTHTVTFFLNCELDSDQKVYGKVSLYTPASQDYIQVPSSADFAFGTADFTIELRVRSPSWSTGGDSKVFYDHRLTGDLTNRPTLYVLNNILRFHNNAADRITASVGALADNTWQHVTVSRVSGTTRLFVDGTQQGSDYADSTNYTAQTLTLGTAGDALGNIYGMTGWIDEVRITKGVGRYTTNFVPQNTPFRNYKPRVKLPVVSETVSETDPYWANVVLLAPFDGTDAATTATDQSTSNHTLTFNATAQLDTAQSKFGSASLLLDGNSDYISIADSADWAFGSGEWTIECHVRFNGDPGTTWMNFVNQWTNAGSQKSWWVGFRDNALQAFTSPNGSSGLFILNRAWNPAGDTWYHVAFCRENLATNVIRVFVDGVQIGADDTSINANPTHFNPTSDVWIGAYNGDANDWLNGWIDNVRITKGVCRYTASFTPPSAPRSESDPDFSSIVLLAPFDGTDAATTATDLSNENHTLTFNATAQLDTAQTKFGTASLLLDGNSDYISIADHASLSFGAGDFTIEAHIRFNGAPGTAGHVITAKWTANGQHEWFFGYRTSQNLEFVHSVNGTNGIISISKPWSPSADTWYHVAVCRDGVNMRLFIDGTQLGTTDTTISTNTIIDTASPVYIGSFSHAGGPFIEFFNGWIDNVCITKGVARYTNTFIPPTGPYPTS